MEFCFQPRWSNRDWIYHLYWDNTKLDIHKTMVFKSWDIRQWKTVMYEWLGKRGEPRDCSAHHLESVSWPQQRGRCLWRSPAAFLSKGAQTSWRPQWLSSQVRVLERQELQREASRNLQSSPEYWPVPAGEKTTRDQKSLEWVTPRAHAVPRMD